MSSKNTNCLAGFKCPKCGQEDNFLIGGHAIFDVSDNGTDVAGGYVIEWEDGDYCACSGCMEEGTVPDFRKESE